MGSPPTARSASALDAWEPPCSGSSAGPTDQQILEAFWPVYRDFVEGQEAAAAAAARDHPLEQPPTPVRMQIAPAPVRTRQPPRPELQVVTVTIDPMDVYMENGALINNQHPEQGKVVLVDLYEDFFRYPKATPDLKSIIDDRFFQIFENWECLRKVFEVDMD